MTTPTRVQPARKAKATPPRDVIRGEHGADTRFEGPDLLSTYLLLWSIQSFVTVKRYLQDAIYFFLGSSVVATPALSFEALTGPIGVLAAATQSLGVGVLAHLIFVAAKLRRQPLQFNSDIWCLATDAAVLVVGTVHLARRDSRRRGAAAAGTRRDDLVLAFAPAVRCMFGAFYLGAGLWKLNTSHLGASTSCSVIYLISMLDAYAPRVADASPRLLRLVADSAGALTCVLETSIGLLLLAPSRRLQRCGVALGVVLHAGICFTPPPNNIGSFSAVAVMRYFCAVPHGAHRAVLWARGRALTVGAALAATCAVASGRVPGAIDDLQSAVFAAISAVLLAGCVVEARAADGDHNDDAKRAPRPPAPPAPAVKRAQRACTAMALVYAFGLPVLGLQDMGNVHMFANLRTHGGSNHLLLPTGLLQRWAAEAAAAPTDDAGGVGGVHVDAGPFAGGVVRVDATTSRWIRGIYPLEVTPVLRPTATARLRALGHAGREFLPLVGRVYGPRPDVDGSTRGPEDDRGAPKAAAEEAKAAKTKTAVADSSNPSVPAEGRVPAPAYTVHALELRRLISEARQRDTNFSITYARLPSQSGGGGGIDWASAATAGTPVTYTHQAGVGGGEERCVVNASGRACAADEPALLPWPPAGPRWAVALLLRVLVFYPVPVLPGFVEMACCDG